MYYTSKSCDAMIYNPTFGTLIWISFTFNVTLECYPSIYVLNITLEIKFWKINI